MDGRRPLTAPLTVLLAVMAMIFVLREFFLESALASWAARLTVEIVLILAVARLSESRVLLGAVLALAAMVEVTAWLLRMPDPAHAAVVLAILSRSAFLALTAGFVAYTIWRVDRITPDAIVGAIAIYLVLGYVWGDLFSLLEYVRPGSFLDPCPVDMDHGCQPEVAEYPRLDYLSFVTLTTLGYGDILPKTRAAEGLAIVASVSGQLFLAILIGRLVGLQLVQSLHREK